MVLKSIASFNNLNIYRNVANDFVQLSQSEGGDPQVLKIMNKSWEHFKVNCAS